MNNTERFKANIRLFEIEPHSFCNRKCWFCPNSIIDRTGPVKFLDSKIYSQALRDLASIDYSGVLSFVGWCEPFSQPQFFDYLKEAKEYLPYALIFSNTNTDYLTSSVIRDAADIGLNVLRAQLYFAKDEECTAKSIRTKMAKLKAKLPGIEFKEQLENKWFSLIGDNMVIEVQSKDFRKTGQNRCDIPIRPVAQRYHICSEPIKFFGINYNGMAVPCCNIRSDYPPHKNMLLGKMDDKPGKIFELYQGVLLPEDKYPCAICMFNSNHMNLQMVFEEILKELKNGQNRSRVNRHHQVAVGS